MESINIREDADKAEAQTDMESINVLKNSGAELYQIKKENLRQFDRRFVETQDIQSVGYRLICGILLLCAGIFACVPVTVSAELGSVNLLLLPLAVFLYIQPYIVVNEQGKNYSVYEKLKWLPVSKKALLNNRIRYITRFVLILFAASLTLQLISCGLSRQLNGLTLLYPVCWNLAAYVAGIVFCLNGYHRG